MAEIKQYSFSHIELAEMMVKNLDIHEGLWAVFFEFGIGGGLVPTTPDGKSVIPAAITLIQKVGLQRAETENSITLDAAKVNPAKDPST